MSVKELGYSRDAMSLVPGLKPTFYKNDRDKFCHIREKVSISGREDFYVDMYAAKLPKEIAVEVIDKHLREGFANFNVSTNQLNARISWDSSSSYSDYLSAGKVFSIFQEQVLNEVEASFKKMKIKTKRADKILTLDWRNSNQYFKPVIDAAGEGSLVSHKKATHPRFKARQVYLHVKIRENLVIKARLNGGSLASTIKEARKV